MKSTKRDISAQEEKVIYKEGRLEMKKHYLMTPGPTPVPEDIRDEMAKPMIHHRTKEYQAIFKDATEGLKKIFKTSGDLFTFTSSGTGAMEASIVMSFRRETR